MARLVLSCLTSGSRTCVSHVRAYYVRTSMSMGCKNYDMQELCWLQILERESAPWFVLICFVLLVASKVNKAHVGRPALPRSIQV